MRVNKQRYWVFFLIFVLVLFSGCANTHESTASQIGPAQLTEEEQALVSFFGQAGQVAWFDYHLNESYQQLKIWVEVYPPGGEPTKRSEMRGQLTKLEGRIGIAFQMSDSINWRIGQIDEGGSSVMEGSSGPLEKKSISTATTQLSSKKNVESEQPIDLFALIVSDALEISIHDPSYYGEKEVGEKEKTVYLVRCSFEREEKMS